MTSSNTESRDQPASTDGDVYGALDLGSNSFHLLLGRFEGGKLLVMDRHKESVRLAEGLNSSGKLSQSVIESALESLRRFAERLRSTPVSHFRVVGTNTLRAAKNADSFLQQAEAILNSPIHIISGSEEARLIYLGVAKDLSPEGRRRLVVDIGGGSTELVVGRDLPRHLESLYLGCVNTTLRYFPKGKLSVKCYRRALTAARAEIQPAVGRFGAGNWDEAVGSSGTIRSVEALLESKNLNRDHTLTLAGLEALAGELCQYDNLADLNWSVLNEDRRRVLPGGLAVLHAVFLELGIEHMHVSNYSLREGVILDLAGRLHNRDTREETARDLMAQYRVEEAQAARVRHCAEQLLDQVREQFDDYQSVLQLLQWAASLHEIGLAVAHSGYHKHGAYLLLHSDMPGFSKQEQKLLSFLVLNHRRKLRVVPKAYGFAPDWRLVQILRLACVFCRRRDNHGLPAGSRLGFQSNGATISLEAGWLAEHPLTQEDLAAEQSYLKSMNLHLEVNVT